MAEKVVIAQLVIDETGAVRAIQSTTNAVGGLEKQTHSTAGVFTERMFSMRHAAVAFLGGFTLAGAILELKTFTEEIVKAASGFSELDARIKAFRITLFEWLGTTGPIRESLEFIDGVLDRIQAFARWWKDQNAGATSAALALIFGQTDKERAAEAQQALYRNNLPPGQNQDSMVQAYQANQQYLYTLKVLGVEGVRDIAMVGDEWQVVAEATGFANNEVETLNEQIDVLVRPSRWQQLKTSIVDAFKEAKQHVGEFISAAVLFRDLMEGAAFAFASAISQGIAEGGLTFKKIIADMLTSVGQMLLAFGALAIIRGYFTGEYHLIAQGAIALAAGAAALVAARTMSHSHSGGNSGGGGGGGGAGPSIGGAAGPSYNISFIVEGHAIVNEDWMRMQTIQLKRALADGAGGGSF